MTRLITAQKPVSDLVQEFAEGDLAIPEIQRDVVWKPDQFKKLVSSIFCQYPCGSLIFWEPRERDVSLVKSMIKPERLKQYEGRLPKYFLLDGQQRLTALASVILERDRLKTLLAEVEEDMPYIFCNLRRFFRNTEHSPDDLEASTDDSGYTFPWVSLHDVLDGDFSQRDDIQRKLPPDLDSHKFSACSERRLTAVRGRRRA
jgi:hypothetical protein